MHCGRCAAAPDGVRAQHDIVRQAQKADGQNRRFFIVIKLIAVKDEKSTSVSHLMMIFLCHFDHSGLANEPLHHGIAQKVVVVADCETDLSSMAREIHETCDNQIALWLPVPSFLQTPSVDEIAHKVEIFWLVIHEKIQQLGCPRVPKSQMQIADEQ